MISLGGVAIHIETVERVEQTHRAANRQIDGFDIRDVTALIEADAQHGFVSLRRNDEPASVVHGHRDPGSFFKLGIAQQFYFETVCHF